MGSITGKSETMAGVPAVASNDCMPKFCDFADCQEDDANKEETQDGQTRQKQGGHCRKKKLRDFE